MRRRNFKKDIFTFMNNAVFRKTMKNVRNHKDIKLATAEARKNHFESKPNYNTIKLSSNDLLAIEMKKKTDTHK